MHGPAFDRQVLQLFASSEVGPVSMATQELAGGRCGPALTLATSIEGAKTSEIPEMGQLRNPTSSCQRLPPSRAGHPELANTGLVSKVAADLAEVRIRVKLRRPSSRTAALLLSALLTATGTLHFLAPDGFEAIVPHFLGDPAIWVRVSGVAELGCAAALAMRRTRRIGGLAAAVLFVAVFPANIQMAVSSGESDSGLLQNPVVAWARLPLQVPLIMWALYASRTGKLDTTKRR